MTSDDLWRRDYLFAIQPDGSLRASAPRKDGNGLVVWEVSAGCSPGENGRELALHATLEEARVLVYGPLQSAAEHPADDAEPVTVDWLRAVGFRQWGTPTDTSLVSPGFGWLHHNTSRETGAVTWWLCGVYGPIPDQPTRGHVRRLCAALGIPLVEGSCP